MKKIGWFILVSAHTLVLAGLSFFWLSLPYTYDNEAFIISLVSLGKNVVLGLEEKPSKNDFLFINIAYEKALIPKTDLYDFEIGTEAITNRARLGSFFSKASSTNQHKFIICDVFLEKPSPDDSILLAAVKETQNVVFPYHRENGEFVKPIIPVPMAFSDYDSDYGNFIKYEYLQYDTCRTIALEVYTGLHGSNYLKKGPFHFNNGRPILNAFIMDLPIRQFDVFREDTLGYNSIHLHNLLELPDALIAETLKDKIIVVGDFLENDMHQTLYGTTAGPLIHLDAYLALRDNKTVITVSFIVYILVIYFIFSFFLFSPGQKLSFPWMEKLQNSRFGGFVFDYLKFAFFLTLMSMVSYLLFGIHLNILVISLYISIIENIVEYIHKSRTHIKVNESSTI